MTEEEKLAQLDFTDPQQMREALEHAKAAAAGSHEGIRLWMLDCGELVAKHQARADAAEKNAALLSRAVHLIGAVARAPEGWEPPTAWHLEAVAFLAECGETREVREYRALMAEQPRTDSKADDPIGELRWELGARTRQYDQVCRDMRALTEEVISALSTAQHRMTLRGGLPFCACGLSLGGGDASGAFITHILAVWTETRP